MTVDSVARLAGRVAGCCVLIAMVFASTSFAQDPKPIEALRHVRITVAEPERVADALESAGFDVLEGSIDRDGFEVVATASDLARLERQGLTYDLIARGRPMREILAEQAARGVPAGYPDLAEVIAVMQDAAANHPGICQFVDLTATYGAPPTFEGRHIHAIKISDNVGQDEDEPATLIVSTHHVRELVTPVIALHAIEQFTTLYGSDPQITDAVDANEIWIAPVWNPDGYVYVFEGDNMWRKNRRVFDGGIGVDLNRNYPFGWNNACSGSSNPSSLIYKGPSAASEAETQTMLAFSHDRRFARVLDYHSSGREALWGFACPDHPFDEFFQQEAIALSNASGYGGDNRPPSADGEHYQWQFATMGAFASLVETALQFQPPYDDAEFEAQLVFPGILWTLEHPTPLTGNVIDADTGDPVEAQISYLNVNFENGETNSSGGSFGQYHAWLPPGSYDVEFRNEEYVTQVHTITVSPVGTTTLDVQLEPYVPAFTFEYPDGRPEFIAPAGEALRVRVIEEPGFDLEPGTAMLHYAINAGGFSTVPLTHVDGDAFDAIFPASICGDQISYYFSAESTDGATVTDPRFAPGESFAAIAAFGQTVALDESLNTDPGWTTEGEWAFGQPTGGGGEYGGPDPTAGFSGDNVYGYNLSGDYPGNLPETHLTSTAIDCTNMTNTVLRFRRWLGVEQPSYDHAYIRVSTDGSNWITIWENDETIADSEWVAVEYDVASIVDGEPTVYLRWTMGETDSIWNFCGWNIDDVELVALECELSCEGDLDNDGFVGVSDLLELLAAWGSSGGDADINGDDAVDVGDLLILLAAWGPCA